MEQACQQLSAKIVILGGGIAGISAANKLSKAGETDFLILEARPRLGGRIHTKKYGNGAVDMGAQYIHGAEGNPIYDLAVQLDNVVSYDESSSGNCTASSSDSDGDSDSDEEDWYRACNFYTSDGKLLVPSMVTEALDVMDQILDECNKFSRENCPNAAGDSIGTYVHREFYKYLRTSNDTSEVRRKKESIFNWRLLLENTENACGSIYELSLFAWGEYLECAGNNDIELKRGFQPILDELLKSVPTEKVYLNTPVKAIYWDTEYLQPPPPRTKAMEESSDNLQMQQLSDVHKSAKKAEGSSASAPMQEVVEKGVVEGDSKSSKVIILTAEGTTVSADHVIVTCSLGYLKRHVQSLFKPLLPNDKVTAIHRMGFGTVDKIFLEFAEPFWDKDCEGICFAWMPDDKFVLNCVENKHYAEYLHHDWYRGVWGFHPVAGHQTLLEGWVAADEARIMETVPDHVVSDVCHELLQRFMGDPSIPKPNNIMRSCWYSDPYSWGSYTYIKDGSTGEDCDTLARPLPSEQMPLLMFAGEATHRTYFSTVHGALLSGQREADRLLHTLQGPQP